MKKLIVLLFLLFPLCVLNSMERNIGIGLGYMGIGYVADRNNKDGYFLGRFLNFWWQSRSGFGVIASPVNFLIHFNNSDHNLLTFANVSLFYNIFEAQDRELGVIGPFVSIHTLDINNPRYIEFRSGITFLGRNSYSQSSIFDSDLFAFEIGYKYNRTNGHGFYIHIGFDLIAGLWIMGPRDEARRHQREQEFR